jgi:hypothetical protein
MRTYYFEHRCRKCGLGVADHMDLCSMCRPEHNQAVFDAALAATGWTPEDINTPERAQTFSAAYTAANERQFAQYDPRYRVR